MFKDYRDLLKTVGKYTFQNYVNKGRKSKMATVTMATGGIFYFLFHILKWFDIDLHPAKFEENPSINKKFHIRV